MAFDLFARVIARRVDARAPLSAPFTLWLSITPALGETSRPTRSPDHEVKRVMDTLQRAVPIPQREIIVRRGLRRQDYRQGAPLATGLQNVENTVHHLAPEPAALGGRDQQRDQRPLGIAQIARIASALALVEASVLKRPHRPPA